MVERKNEMRKTNAFETHVTEVSSSVEMSKWKNRYHVKLVTIFFFAIEDKNSTYKWCMQMDIDDM